MAADMIYAGHLADLGVQRTVRVYNTTPCRLCQTRFVGAQDQYAQSHSVGVSFCSF